MPEKSPSLPEQSFSISNLSAAVFANSKGDRNWRTVNFQRSYQDNQTREWKNDALSLGLGDINSAIRVLMLARRHIDSPPPEAVYLKPERAFQIGLVSTAIFSRQQEHRTVRDTVLQRDYQDDQQQWQRQKVRFYQQELSNAIHMLSLARDYLEQTEADVTELRQGK